ncbi:hypothetical protein V8C35DRAFT_302158 [Trichoderma chlorosporum]
MDKKRLSPWRSLYAYSAVIVLSLLLFLYAGSSRDLRLESEIVVARAVQHENVTSHLFKRDQVYDRAVLKGNRLHCSSLPKKLSDPPQIEAASYLQTFGLEAREGWEESIDGVTSGQPLYGNNLDAAFAGLGITGAQKHIAWEHEKSVQIEINPTDAGTGPRHLSEPSYASFMSTFVSTDGVIVADSNFSVDAIIAEDGLPDGVEAEDVTTHVRRWSDAAWMQWTKYSDDPSNVRYIFRASVINHTTLSIVFQALLSKYQNNPPPIGVWANRLTLDVSENPNEFYAVLGSPNGAGVAFLLATHKAALGIKTVNKVDIFTGNAPFAVPNQGIGAGEGAGIVLLFYVTAP